MLSRLRLFFLFLAFSTPLHAGIDAGGGDNLSPLGIDAGGGDNAYLTGIDAGGGNSYAPTGIDAGGADNLTPMGIDAGGGDNAYLTGIDAGGGDSYAPTGIDAGGTDSLSGPVSVTDKLLVQGIIVDASTAAIFRHGVPAAITDLRDGQVLIVQGQPDGAGFSAKRIDFGPVATGPVADFDAGSGKLIVAGQQFQLDRATVFESGLDALRPGSRVEINAVDSGPVRTVTRIATARDRHDSVLGVVTSVDGAMFNLALGSLSVRYDRVQLLDVARGEPRTGQRLLVSGTLSPEGNTLSATSIDEY